MKRAGFVIGFLLLAATGGVAEMEIILGWERPVRFAVIDAETGEPVPRPLLIVATEKLYEGSAQPVVTYKVLRGTAAGTVDYQASEKNAGVELQVTAPGHELLVKQVSWKELPPRQRDERGSDVGPVPVIPVELNNLERLGEWKQSFRLNIRPSLEELLQLPAHAMSRQDRKVISDFIDRQENSLLGF